MTIYCSHIQRRNLADILLRFAAVKKLLTNDPRRQRQNATRGTPKFCFVRYS